MTRLLILSALLTLVPLCNTLNAQDTLFNRLLRENAHRMEFNEGSFSGAGWDMIMQDVDASQNVLIGEDHFTNEIPAFIREVALGSSFDNFYIEIDPYTTRLIEQVLNGSATQKKSFLEEYGTILSFYSLPAEWKMLEAIHGTGVGLLGSDQIVMYDDRLLFDDLAKTTRSKEAAELYGEVADKSRIALDSFLVNPSNPMYMMTPEFSEKLSELQVLDISPQEREIVDALELSAEIYQTQSHRKRVELLIRQLMKDYPKWKDKRNLFKYGASHMSRSESILNIHDIGNLVANITLGNAQKSLHIMILGESGFQGSPFPTFPPSEVDPANSYYLDYLMPFISFSKGDEWFVFDLRPIRRALYRKQIHPDNLNMIRALTGYDYLVLIPEVTAARFD